MKRENLIIKKVKDGIFLGLYKYEATLGNLPQEVFEVFWCDTAGKILDEAGGSLKAYFKYDLAQHWLYAYADGYVRGLSDGLNIA